MILVVSVRLFVLLPKSSSFKEWSHTGRGQVGLEAQWLGQEEHVVRPDLHMSSAYSVLS
jgi:hypothetical protein